MHMEAWLHVSFGSKLHSRQWDVHLVKLILFVSFLDMTSPVSRSEPPRNNIHNRSIMSWAAGGGAICFPSHCEAEPFNCWYRFFVINDHVNTKKEEEETQRSFVSHQHPASCCCNEHSFLACSWTMVCLLQTHFSCWEKNLKCWLMNDGWGRIVHSH